MALSGSYNSTLVALSIIVAIVTSNTALDLASRASNSKAYGRNIWLCVAAVAAGGGIWSMHCIAMMAFHIGGLDMSYDPVLSAIAFCVAIFASLTAFVIALRRRATLARLSAASIVMGCGIAGMHYIGMDALRMNAVVSYDPVIVGASIAAAVGASFIALRLAARHHLSLAVKLFASSALGMAIAGMHYLGMAGSSFTAKICHIPEAHLNQTQIALFVGGMCLFILVSTSIAAWVDRSLAYAAEQSATAAEAREETFRNLYTRTPSPLLALTPEGYVEHVTDQWLRMMGYQRDEVIGRMFINFLDGPSTKQLVQEDWPSLLQSGAMTDIEYRGLNKGADPIDFVVSATVDRDAEGAMSLVLMSFVNVTHLKRMEAAIYAAQSDQLIGRLTGGVAHEFNNILHIILQSVEMSIHRFDQQNGDSRTLGYLKTIMMYTTKGASLTERMLTFARRQTLYPTTVDVPRLVNETVDFLEKTVGPTIKISVDAPPTISPALVDETKLQQAIVALGVNSRDAMPNGGSIRIEVSEVPLEEARGPLHKGRYIRLLFQDDGCGMDESTLRHATEPFFTTKAPGKGTGLGLPTTKGMAEQSGGCLVLRSEQTHGTTVELWLPVDDSVVVKGTTLQGPAVEMEPLTILVVDDDEAVLMATTSMLEGLGHTCIEAHSAEVGLSHLRETNGGVDLVVTDQLMPGMVGSVFAEKLMGVWPDLPVLIVTGYAELPPGCLVPRLGKPFNQKTLAAAIEQVVQGKPRTRSGASVAPAPV